MTLGDPEKAVSVCGKFPDDRQDICYGASAQTVLEEGRSDSEKAVALCGLAPGDHASACMHTLIDHATSIFGENIAEYNRFCAALPKAFYEQCASAGHP